jgi:molybdopterin converting factor small subunit
MIRVTLRAHSTLKKVFGHQDMIISVPEDSTMREVFDQAIGRIKERLEQRYGLQGAQDLQKYFILLLNGKQLLRLENLGIQVKEGDEIEILEPMAGGSEGSRRKGMQYWSRRSPGKYAT